MEGDIIRVANTDNQGMLSAGVTTDTTRLETVPGTIGRGLTVSGREVHYIARAIGVYFVPFAGSLWHKERLPYGKVLL